MLSLGQILQGKLDSYKIVSKLYATVWLAVSQSVKHNVIVKHADHWRVGNERDMLLRFQTQTPHLRPLLDEVELEGTKWPALIMRHLDRDLLVSSNKRKLTPAEVKTVGKGVLEALVVLHKDGFVHTDIKPSNILVNYDPTGDLITEVQLADLEATVSRDSKHARDGEMMGTPIFRSTEAILQMRWDMATDIWSFGATMISILYGEDFHLFNPDVPADHEDHTVKILQRQHQFFGPWPLSYKEIADDDRLEVLTYIINNTSDESMKPFKNVSTKELTKEDKAFVLKIMKLDPRDRPTASELLADEWFSAT